MDGSFVAKSGPWLYALECLPIFQNGKTLVDVKRMIRALYSSCFRINNTKVTCRPDGMSNSDSLCFLWMIAWHVNLITACYGNDFPTPDIELGLGAWNKRWEYYSTLSLKLHTSPRSKTDHGAKNMVSISDLMCEIGRLITPRCISCQISVRNPALVMFFM